MDSRIFRSADSLRAGDVIRSGAADFTVRDIDTRWTSDRSMRRTKLVVTDTRGATRFLSFWADFGVLIIKGA